MDEYQILALMMLVVGFIMFAIFVMVATMV